MSLRDYFAAKAMQAFIIKDAVLPHDTSENSLTQYMARMGVGVPEAIAIKAYEQADTMLEARKP